MHLLPSEVSVTMVTASSKAVGFWVDERREEGTLISVDFLNRRKFELARSLAVCGL